MVTNTIEFLDFRDLFWIKMDVFSLEEDYNSLFVTQSDNSVREDTNDSGILGDGYDFKSPVRSVTSCSVTQYSDFSDDEDDFQMPSSQQQFKEQFVSDG